MAQATEYSEISAIANKKTDQLDIITLVEPAETPIFTSAQKYRKVNSSVFEYYADSLDDVSLDTVADGKDVDDFGNKTEHRVKIQQRTQIQNKTWKVSRGLQEDTDTAGVKDEVQRAKMLCAIELKRNIEAAIGSDQEAGFSEDSGNKMRALGAFLDEANDLIPTPVRMKEGAKAVTNGLTESAFRKVLQTAYEATGNSKGKYRLFAGPELQNAITGFSRTNAESGNILAAQLMAGSKEITCSVQIYNSDFGTVFIIPSMFLGYASNGGLTDAVRGRGYLVDMDNFAISFNKNLWDEEYEDRGGGRRGAVWAKYTIINKCPKAMGKFVASAA